MPSDATEPKSGKNKQVAATTQESDPFTEIDWENIVPGEDDPEAEPVTAPATTEPSATQPVAAAPKPATTQPSTPAKPAEETASSSEKKGPATPGAGFVVTELPVEEVKPDAPLVDDNNK
jgi:hypothetical protein